MKQYLLFDLDGTLTDPKVGITTCVQYALKSFGIEENDLDKLEPFIGPPLKDSFMEFYQMSEEQAEEAIAKYRERFQDTGIFENKVYQGIPQMLRTLQSKGIFLAVASSKPQVFVERILEHFELRKYFAVVVGSELDGTRVNKDEVVREALNRLSRDGKPVDRKQVYMIGDRKFDVEAAKELGIESVGVAYGYGSMEELKEAKADYIVRSVEELEKFLLRGADEKKEQQVSPKVAMRKRMWMMLYSFLIFMIVRNLAVSVFSMIFQYLGSTIPSPACDFFVIKAEDGTLVSFTRNASTLLAGLGFVGAAIAVWPNAKLLLTKTKEDMKLSHLKAEPVKSYVFLGLAVVGVAWGLSLLFELTGFISNSEAYLQIAEAQHADSLLIMLLCYGIMTPVAEELLFRGIIYGYMRRFMTIPKAILFSSALFGFYHMNPVQGVYGFLMGCLMAYAFEYFGSFKAAVAVHVGANVLASLLTYTPIASTAFLSWPVCVILLAAGGFGVYGLMKQKKIF